MKTRLVLLLAWLIIFPLSLLVWVYMGVGILFNVERATSIALGWDRLGNASLGQGDMQTISSWSGRHGGWQERFIDWIFFNMTGEVNHCDNNIE